MKNCILGVATALVLAACGPKMLINETRMIAAPARPADCALQFVQVDITSRSFNSTWDILGYVSMIDSHAQDPNAEENRALVRGKACNMGGTSVAVAANSTNTNQFGNSGSTLAYMVLRPKAPPSAPSAF